MRSQKTNLKLLGILPLFLLILGHCHSQDLYYEQFTESDGLPSMMTYEMVQDSNGVLWVGTENGLVSYDGEEFVTHTHPKLIDHDIIEIALDKNGRVYFVNLSKQFGYIEEDVVHLIDTESIGNKITDIIINEKNSYAHLFGIGNFRFSQNEDNQFLFKKSLVNAFFIKDKIIEEGYKTELTENSWHIKSKSYEFEYFSAPNLKYVMTKDNRLFFSSSSKEFYEIDSAIYPQIKMDNFLRYVKIYDKSFLIIDNGILLYNSSTNKSNFILKSKLVNTVFIDKEGNIWFSTQNEGLIKIPYIDFQLKSNVNDLGKGYGINDFERDDNGNIYLGTTTGQILIYSNERKLIKKIIVSKRKKPVSLQKYGNEIFGKCSRALIAINQQTLDYKTSTSRKTDVKSFIFNEDTIYIGSRIGIFKLKFEEFTTLKESSSTAHFLSGYWVNAMYKEGSNKSYYVATSTGLFKIDSLGVPTPILIDGEKEYNVSSIIKSDQNSIWIGTRNAGAIKLRNDTIVEKYNTSNGLISNNVNSLAITDNKLIVSTVDGVGIKYLDENKTRTINELGGVIPKEIFHCDIVDDDYWLATNEGLTIVKKDQLKYFKKQGPILSIKNIYANGDKIKLEEEIKLSHEINNIQINFRNVSLQSEKNKTIKYRISASDTTWIYSKEPLIRLQSLKYGTYNIEAIGISSMQDEGNKVSLKITISPPWWQTTWARVLGLILAFIGVQFILRRRTKRIRTEESTKRDYLTQINNIKDQALQLQMNPHFIFNSLNAIQNFIGTDEEEMAMNYLARFARLIRLIFEHSKGTTITLEDEIEFVNLYLDLEKLRFKDKINIHLNIDPNVQNAKDIIKIPPLLIQPIIENSFKHGLFHKKTTGNLYIDYSIDNTILKVTIQDDGIGRKQSEKIELKNLEKQTSSGIKTTLERLDLLNFSKNKKNNTMIIEDLLAEDGSAAGTRTMLCLEVF